MSDEHIISVVHGWDTVRFELLNTRICDLPLRIEGSALEPLTLRLHRELEARGIQFKPEFYLTDGWGCPDRVPIIGIPFYLADQKLRRLEEEQKSLESLFQQPVQDPAAIEKGHRRYREIAALLEAKLARWELLAGRAGG